MSDEQQASKAHVDPGPSPGPVMGEGRTATEGEWRVGLDFNPSGDPRVTSVKQRAAQLIDDMLAISNDRSHPGARNAAIAATQFEDAAMNAVKALTKRPR